MEATNEKKALFNWKLHITALLIVIICEMIGSKTLNTPVGAIVLLPMIYAIAFGIVAGLPKIKLLSNEDQTDSNSVLAIACLLYTSRCV